MGTTAGQITQNRIKPDGGTLFGSGKVRDLKALLAETAANTVVFDNPLNWPLSEAVATGSRVTFDAGNVNATTIGGTHYLSFYSGKAPDTAVLVSVIPAPPSEDALISPSRPMGREASEK